MVDGSIRIDTKIDQTGVNKGLADIEKSCSSFVGVASGILAGIGLFEFGKAALKSTADIELAQAKLTTLLGSADHAQSMINDIVKMADATPYNSNDLIQAATTLKTFGVTADQIMPTLTALGNAAGGQAQNLQGVAYALGQTAAQGKMMTQDLYQFINAGVPLLDLLAKRLDKSKAEIKGMIEQGKIGYKEVNGALQEFYTGNGKYANLMAEAAKTLPGMWSTFQDSVTSFGRALVSVFEGPIKTALGVFTSMFTTLARVFNDMSAPAKNVLASFGGSVAIFVALTAAVGIATTAFSTLFTVLRSNPFMLIIGLIGTMIIKLMDLGDAAQDTMGLQPAEAERAIKTYERLIKTQNDVLESAERAGDPNAAIAGYKRVEDALQYNIDKLNDLTPASAEWLQTVSQAAAQSKFLQTSKTLGFVTQEDVLKADELAAKFEMLYRAKRRAAAEETGGAGGDTGGTGATVSAVSNRRKLWEDYFAWQTGQEYGSMEADLYVLHTKYAAELDAMKDGDELKEALIEKQAGEEQAIRDKWAHRHKIAAFFMGLGIAEKTAEGMESGLHAVQSAVEDIGEAIADTFEVMSEIFDFGASVLDGITDFKYSDLESRLTKYITAIGDFFKNNLGSLSVLFDVGAAAVEQLLAGMLSNLPAIVSSIGNLIQHIADYIINNGGAIISSVTTIVFAIVETLIQKAPELFKAVLFAVIEFIQNLASKAETFMGFVGAAISSIITAFFNALPTLLTSLVALAINLLNAIVAQLPQILSAIAGAIGPLADALAKALPPLLIGIINAIVPIALALVNALPEIFKALVNAIPLLIEQLILASPEIVAAMVRAFVMLHIRVLPVFIKALGKMFVDFHAALVKWTAKIYAAVGVAFGEGMKKWFSAMYKAGGQLIDGLVKGFTDGAPDLWRAVKRIFTDFIDSIKNFFGIHSPSTVFFELGVNMMQGLINGILAAGGALKSIAGSIFRMIVEAFNSMLSALSGAAGALPGVFTSALQNALNSIKNIASSFYDAGKDIGKQLIAGINSSLGSVGNSLSEIYNYVKDNLTQWLPDIDWPDWLASGTKSASGGWTVVGEKGPEMMNLKSGATVLSASDSIRAVMGALTPQVAAAPSASFSFSGEISAADVVIDGNTVGKIAFRYIDKQVKAAYGA